MKKLTQNSRMIDREKVARKSVFSYTTKDVRKRDADKTVDCLSVIEIDIMT